MKKLIVIITAVILMMPVFGQELFQTMVDKYSDKEGFSAVQLTKDMFDIYLKKKNIDEKDPVYAVVDKLNNILVITQTKVDEKENSLKPIQTEILEYYKKNGLSLFKTEKNGDNDLKIFVKKENEKVSSLGLVNLTELTLTLIEINGSIDMASIASLSRAFNIRGLEALRRIDESSNYYGNSTSNSVFVVGSDNKIYSYSYDFPELRIPSLSAEKRKELEMNSKKELEKLKANQAEWFQYEDGMKKKIELNKKYNRVPIIVSGDMDNAEYFINGKKVDKDEFRKLQPDQIERVEATNTDDKDGKTKCVVKITLKK